MDLPAGVTRNSDCTSTVTLENCHALYFEYQREDGSCGLVIAWRWPRPNIWPIEVGKRLRDLRPGDAVMAFGCPATLTRVEVYR